MDGLRPRLLRLPVLPVLAVSALACLGLPGLGRTATMSLQASQDSYVQQDSVTSNFGAATTIQVKSQSSAAKRALVKFDLSSVPACAMVTAASLQMRLETNTQNLGGDDHVHGVYRVTASWTEGGVTWANRDVGTSWTSAGGDFNATVTATATAPAGTGWLVQWNVTTDVLAFRAGTAVNNGWLVKDQGEASPPTSSSGYSSRMSGTVANRPVLVLTLTGNDPACADSSPCTVDTCDPLVGCENVAGNAGTVCRTAVDACDAPETCSGASTSCPADALRPSTFQCRSSAGVCDPAEFCTGASAACPADAKSTAVCRSANGTCDVAESCNGIGNTCPSDGFAASGILCRTSAGACDAAESCTGSSATCPADGFLPSTVECRASAGVCDPPESCTGTGAVCPADAKSTSECRASLSPCDGTENCDGVNPGCPADVVAASGTVCRAATGPCDAAETCNGTSGTCPADGLAVSGTVCRSAAGACDVAETCTGASTGCPADVVRPSGTMCRTAAGVCDMAEVCSGTSGVCPADALVSSGTVCRAPANACDGAETCTGSSASCPPDTGFADGDGDGICDTLDDCPSDFDPAQLDTDDDGMGDACDPCTNAHLPEKPKLKMKNFGPPAGDDKLTVKGVVILPHPFSPPLDPVAKGARLAIHDANGVELLDVTIPGGTFDGETGVGWKVVPGVFRYRNASSTPDPALRGITKVVLVDASLRTPGMLKYTVTGKKSSYTIGQLPLRTTFVIDAPVAQTGQCAEEHFTGPPELAPSCALNAPNVLICK